MPMVPAAKISITHITLQIVQHQYRVDQNELLSSWERQSFLGTRHHNYKLPT